MDSCPCRGLAFFGMLIIGILAGYIAEKVTTSDQGLLTNLLVGIAGSFVGGLLASLLGFQHDSWLRQSPRRIGRRHSPAMGVAEIQGNGLSNRLWGPTAW